MRDKGRRSLVVPTDITDPASVQAMVDATIAEFGRIDILLNNAGGATAGMGKPLEEVTDEEWRLGNDTNLSGTFYCCRAVIPHMLQQGGGKIINLTSGMGGDLAIGHGESPMDFGNDSDLVGPATRLAHVEELLPEICSLDCGTLNFGDGNMIYVSTPDMLRAGAAHIQSLGVKPELECFDTGHLWFARQMIKEGLVDSPPMFQLCHGIPWGAPADTTTMKAMVDNLPEDAVWAGFGIGRMEMPMVAQTVLLGGHVRVGLEDNLYLEKGVHASNGALVERAASIVTLMGAKVVGPDEARAKLGLKKRAS